MFVKKITKSSALDKYSHGAFSRAWQIANFVEFVIDQKFYINLHDLKSVQRIPWKKNFHCCVEMKKTENSTAFKMLNNIFSLTLFTIYSKFSRKKGAKISTHKRKKSAHFCLFLETSAKLFQTYPFFSFLFFSFPALTKKYEELPFPKKQD